MARTADTERTATSTARSSRRALALAATALLLVGATSCADDTSSESSASTSPAPNTGAIADVGDGVAADQSVLTDDEIAGLLWMREEEQLAHDVYVVLGDMWGLRIFENISASETTHIDEVAALLDRYGIDDPATGNQPGTFTDPAIQALYDRLVTDASESLEAALTVGALIEELDIADLQTRAAATETTEITAVYANLERGSRNHLRAFTSQLDSRGVVYEPTRLDPIAFDAIVAGETERGRDR